MPAIFTGNLVSFISGGKDGVAGTATQVSTTTLFVYEVTFTAAEGTTWFGSSTVEETSGLEDGIKVLVNNTVTFSVPPAESLGFRGAQRGQRFIDLAEIYFDVAGATDRITWIGFGPGTETA